MQQPLASRDDEEEDTDQGSVELTTLQPADTDGVGQELQQYGQYPAEMDSRVLYFSMVPVESMEPEEENSDLLDSTASPEELEDEENSGDNESVVTKSCTYQGCQETTSQVAKQRKPWMCKKHRNKMYKDKYKNKKKNDQAISTASKLEDNPECPISLTKQRSSSVGDRPARPTLLEQVLNQKRLSLLRSPEVVHFLQTQQQLLSRQALEQRQSSQGTSQ
ncbi:regulatory factor X-associated protein [Xenopus tropicalis]|uniref:Regulatory factor X-associated protein n=1 Tax=Xenopus tropicalis TaxID=8364 RepID=A0A7D9NKQ2_XENTR|nr:regulatory factor X-associated protein [Xenopus tropicalis]|eukprot:XP_002939627.1 PREDICTED: regulatory factor X-associated protein [Xenopus tropicalis]